MFKGEARSRRSMRRVSVVHHLRSAPKYALLLVFAAIFLFPVVLLSSTALKAPEDLTIDPFALFTSVNPQNFIDAWTVGGFSKYMGNTMLIVVPTVLLTVVLSTLAGYAFARLPFPGRNFVFYVFIGGLMVPFFTLMIPLFYTLRDLGLLNTYWAVILPLVSGANGAGASAGLAFGIFLMRSFFIGLPDELEHAGRVDGCSEWSLFRHVMLPLAAPAAGTLATFAFIQAWNSFLVPLIFLTDQDKRPLATGLYMFTTGRTAEVGLLAAGTMLMIIPVVLFFLVFQGQFRRGVLGGALKG